VTSFSLQQNKCNNASFYKTALAHTIHSIAAIQLLQGVSMLPFYSRYMQRSFWL